MRLRSSGVIAWNPMFDAKASFSRSASAALPLPKLIVLAGLAGEGFFLPFGRSRPGYRQTDCSGI
jgi:hypothetical protein